MHRKYLPALVLFKMIEQMIAVTSKMINPTGKYVLPTFILIKFLYQPFSSAS